MSTFCLKANDGADVVGPGIDESCWVVCTLSHGHGSPGLDLKLTGTLATEDVLHGSLERIPS